MSLVLTKAALALKNAESNFQFVKFESYKPKKKQTADNMEIDTGKVTQTFSKPNKDLDLKKIRHEVYKFGMSGFDPTKKQEAKIALAVSLGAKPPKREYVNYKELMQKRKLEKQKEKDDQVAINNKNILQMGVKKKKKTQNDVGHFLSGYGKVQKKDLKKGDNGPKKKKKKK
ncbi:hypothetical protein evm_005040 [Chilo suppressalis]|nr:hypothetical protein evm_005040 [Chilo suppressalis]